MWDVVKRMGYTPNVLGRNLRVKATRKILVLVPSLANQFYASVIRGMETVARREQYQVLISATYSKKETEKELISMLYNRSVDGIILLSSQLSSEELTEIAQSKPLVLCCDCLLYTSRGALSRMIDLSVGFHDNKISHYRADGLIISTPTGSTAYSLSAGGPVIEPVMRCMLLTPICSHSLFSRSVLFGEDAKLTVQAAEGDDNEIFLTIDGETSVQLHEDDTVAIQAAEIEVSLIKIKDISFYEVLNEKLSERRI